MMAAPVPAVVRCAHCPAFMVPRPLAVQTPEQKATGPWWDHPPVAGQIGLFGHTISVTFGGVR